jgi:hypothetical protein
MWTESCLAGIIFGLGRIAPPQQQWLGGHKNRGMAAAFQGAVLCIGEDLGECLGAAVEKRFALAPERLQEFAKPKLAAISMFFSGASRSQKVQGRSYFYQRRRKFPASVHVCGSHAVVSNVTAQLPKI